VGSKTPAPAVQTSATAVEPKALVTSEGRALRWDQFETSQVAKAMWFFEALIRSPASGVSFRSAMRTLAPVSKASLTKARLIPTTR